MPFQHIKKFYFDLVPSLTDAVWNEIESCAAIAHYKKGEYYIIPGEVERFVTFINSGGFRYFINTPDQEITCCFAFENEYISEYESFLKQQPAHMYIQALEDSEVVKFHYSDVQQAYEKHPPLQKLGRLIAEKFLLDSFERSNSLLSQSPDERYSDLIVNHPKLLQRVPQYMIASYIGITPETLSRIRKRVAV